MNPLHDPGEYALMVYKSKLRTLKNKDAVFHLKAAIKVLRFNFGFSPEMIREFQDEFEKEIKKELDKSL